MIDGYRLSGTRSLGGGFDRYCIVIVILDPHWTFGVRFLEAANDLCLFR